MELSLEDSLLDISTLWVRKKVCTLMSWTGGILNH